MSLFGPAVITDFLSMWEHFLNFSANTLVAMAMLFFLGIDIDRTFIEYILKSSICMTLIYGHVHSDGFPKIKTVFILT